MSDLSNYYKYLISNMVEQCNYIERYGINQNDKDIKDSIEDIAKKVNIIYNQMSSIGVDIENILKESYDIEANIRDFKIKRITENEGN